MNDYLQRIDRPLAAETVPHGFPEEATRDWVAAVYVRRTDASKEALARAEAAADALFEEGRGCLLCHVKEGSRIAEPRVPRSWMNRARFVHETHRFEQCSKCHDMSQNADAETLAEVTRVLKITDGALRHMAVRRPAVRSREEAVTPTG